MSQSKPQVHLATKFCRVTVDSLKIRAGPNAESRVVNSYPKGTQLNYVEVVEGEFVDGNPYWGHSAQGNYYWMGGTDRPTG